ncbi:MAG: exopolyphosphatase / guanosine-5-triphosphate,3-diphosphate pyrophosphatase [Thermoanaerobaculia bacterium]|jgi:exopolyphosphatase/guanosine-5'-triphosphate,3'-diphosphate pyrophosphatase|nr:exopolyphosphatase / guanosine-5-triphosphate,3-diphosphate pyrophosphatase [Thermoanaerobaculia bacterium]
MPEKTKRIAAIDVGTNSIHMIVAETRDRGYRVVDREKEMVQLGLASLDGEPLTEDAIVRGVASIGHMAEIAAKWNVDEVFAVATSAVREAPNRRDFLKRVKDATGVKVRVISGEEEADYIFRAVRSAVDVDGQTALCIDIGGGSVEMIVGTADETYFTRSEPLGALRLAQRFDLTDRPTPRALDECRNHIEARINKLRRRIRRLGVDLCAGTSGTIQTLATMASPAESQPPAHGLRRLERAAVQDLIPVLASMTASERAERFSLDAPRSTSILAGALVLATLMESFDIEELLACPLAMREGMLESRIAAADKSDEDGGSLRHASVLALAQRTDVDLKHGTHVAKLAARIFDQTKALHALEQKMSDLLESAAVLHEAGLHVSDRAHHKHSYYLIRHADLRGYTDEEILLVANTARYYRKAPPDPSHDNFAELTHTQQQDVEKLAAILRIAEALDRGHRRSVRDVAVRVTREQAVFTVRTRSDSSVEIASARKRAKYFAALFEVEVRFETM